MKVMPAVRTITMVLMVSQLSSCAWVSAWKSRFQTVSTKPEPRSGPKPQEFVPAPPTSPPPGRDQKLPEPQPQPAPEPEPQRTPDPLPKANVPTARAVPGRPGFVFSPFNNKLIDVDGIASGRLVADPHYPAEEKKYFRVP